MTLKRAKKSKKSSGSQAHEAVVPVFSPQYLALRQRFLDHFYFEGRVANAVAPGLDGGEITFGDQTIYLGQALLTFATEMALGRAAGSDTSEARALVEQLLQGIEELERKGNERFGSGTSEPNGLFVRDDITGPDDPRLRGRFRVVHSDWQEPELENASPSGDQIFGLMAGLYGVVQYSGDAALTSRAQATASRLFDYAKRTDFILRLPNGDETRRGSDMRWLASLLNGMNKAITGEDHFSECRIEVGGFRIPLNGIAAFWDDDRTPATIARLTGQSIHIPIIERDYELNSFALHVLLMAISPGEVWSKEEVETVALKAHHHLAALLYSRAHGTTPDSFTNATVQEILDACPTTGPAAGIDPGSGWQHDNRWIRCTDIFYPTSGMDAYSGVDWLLLSNFRSLVYPNT